MSTSIKDLARNVVVSTSLSFLNRTSSANGAGVDLGGGDDQAFAILFAGAVTDGTHDVAIQESRNDNVSGGAGEAADPYAAVSPAAAFVQVVAAKAHSFEIINFKRSKRYARAALTVATATTGGALGVLIGSPKKIY